MVVGLEHRMAVGRQMEGVTIVEVGRFLFLLLIFYMKHGKKNKY
jgi:hypothetical protein